ncbi:MAG: transporter [Pseudomonadota bacterium]
MDQWQAVISHEVPKWKDKFAIVGIGDTEYSRKSGVSTTVLGLEAAKKAAEDAGLKPRDIDGMIEGMRGKGPSNEEFQVAFGHEHLRFFSRALAGGAGGIFAIQTAMAALSAGLCNYVMITYAMNGSSESRLGAKMNVDMGTIQGGELVYQVQNWYLPFGLQVTGTVYSFVCRRFMHDYGLTRRQLGALPVAWRKHAHTNPKALMRGRPLTIEDYMNSPILIDPFCRWDFSLQSDGGAAFILTTTERAKDLKQTPAKIMGVGVSHPSFPNNVFARRELPWGAKWAGPIAYKMSGVSPKEIEFCELYDGFTFVGMVQLPSLGFCKAEEAGEWCQNGRIELGGELPTNTHGGLCSEAHVGGWNSIVEAVRQLRGVRGDGQVKKKNGSICEIGMVTGAGDLGDGAVAILRR